jgi:hypothetical protein
MNRRKLAAALAGTAVLMATIGGFVWVRSGAANRVAPAAESEGYGSLQAERGN